MFLTRIYFYFRKYAAIYKYIFFYNTIKISSNNKLNIFRQFETFHRSENSFDPETLEPHRARKNVQQNERTNVRIINFANYDRYAFPPNHPPPDRVVSTYLIIFRRNLFSKVAVCFSLWRGIRAKAGPGIRRDGKSPLKLSEKRKL